MIYLFNGPPRSGKDTAGEILAALIEDGQEPDVLVTKFAHALKIGTHGLFAGLGGIDPHDEMDSDALAQMLTNDALYEDMKDKPLSCFGGKTPRECYIAVSELLIKPFFGDTYFGDVMASRIERCDGDAIITDSGFACEAGPLVERFGADNIHLIRMWRKGCDFSNDSRSYIELPNVRTTDIANNGSLQVLTEVILHRVLER